MAGESVRMDLDKLTGWIAAFSLLHPQFLQLLRRAQSSRRSMILFRHLFDLLTQI